MRGRFHGARGKGEMKKLKGRGESMKNMHQIAHFQLSKKEMNWVDFERQGQAAPCYDTMDPTF